jgi:phosphopantothenoylcysteine decarboxylase/phosphopantothenate--cysteine ligase
MLRGKKIILGVCGSISAYKAPIFLRLLLQEGAQVRVVITPSAARFVSPLVLETLSGHPVAMDWTKEENPNQWHNHVAWGCWADLFIVAPASAETLHHLAQGAAPHFLAGVYLSARCPVMIAPAMDHDMYLHPAVKRNLNQLAQDGCHIIPAAHGPLASGLVGEGRLPEPEELLHHVQSFFQHAPGLLEGKTVLITSGPTREPIDPVRFISNHSSGKMGAAIAEAAKAQGAKVIFITGPAQVQPSFEPEVYLHVETAQDMLQAVLTHQEQADWFFFAAAVADKRPSHPAKEKLKKDQVALDAIALTENPDILATVGHQRKKGTVVVGFALETSDGLKHAQEKCRRKNADYICLNLHQPDLGTGFGSDTNEITVVSPEGNWVLPYGSKTALAHQLIAFIHAKETS